MNLGCKLACWAHHQSADAACASPRIFGHRIENWQGECGGLTCARLGATEYVAALNEIGNGLSLYRRRRDVTNLVEGIQQGLTEIEGSEIHRVQLTYVR